MRVIPQEIICRAEWHDGCSVTTCSPTMPTTEWPSASGRVPDGIIAAALACAIAAVAAQGMRAWVRHLADRHVPLITTGAVPSKYQTLTFQRAALAGGHGPP